MRALVFIVAVAVWIAAGDRVRRAVLYQGVSHFEPDGSDHAFAVFVGFVVPPMVVGAVSIALLALWCLAGLVTR